MAKSWKGVPFSPAGSGKKAHVPSSHVKSGEPRLSCDDDGVYKRRVVSPGAIQGLEGDRVRPSPNGEHGRRVRLVRRPRGSELAHHDAVNQHLEVLLRHLFATLGGAEG